MAIPSFLELYDAAKAVITADPNHTLDDYTDGSWLDAFTGVAAGAAQGVTRYAQRQLARFFRSSATGDDLDDLVRDYFGTAIVRLAGESDADFNARVDEYVESGLVRGTPSALQWLLDQVIDGIEPATTSVTEDELTGIVTLNYTATSGNLVADIDTAINAVIREWRPAGRAVNLNGTEAA